MEETYSKCKELNEDLIPEGHYCYVYNKNEKDDWCPYYHSLTIDDKKGDNIYVPYCVFLKAGSIHNNTTDEDFERIKEYFKFETDEEAWDSELFCLDLLWDACKECGINYGDEKDLE